MTTDYDLILERASSDTFWVPETVGVERRTEIAYTYSDQPVEFYNRVLYSRGDAAQHEPLVAEVLRAHGDRPSSWTLNPANDTLGLRALLRQHGYVEGPSATAHVLICAEYDRLPPEDVVLEEVKNVEQLSQLYRIHNVCFERTRELSDEELAQEVYACTKPDRRVIRYIATRRGKVAGAGSMTLHPELDFAMIWAGCVVPSQRDQGVYTALLHQRIRIALKHQITALGLYARDDTSAPIVAAQGFKPHGAMTLFVRK